MIGVDIAKISRFQNPEERFLQRILSPTELEEYYNKTKNQALFLATRWAIKEAIFKADNQYFQFDKINIVKKIRTYFFEGFVISTSKEADLVIAFVIKLKG